MFLQNVDIIFDEDSIAKVEFKRLWKWALHHIIMELLPRSDWVLWASFPAINVQENC